MFSKFFIDRPILSNVIGIVLLLLGIVSVFTLPVAQYPEITPPTVLVNTSYPGASAEVLANTVAAPIEEQVNGVEGMLYMSSTSANDGNYQLTVTFAVGTDIDIATVLVQNRVNIAVPQLPQEVKQQGVSVQKQSPSILQVITLTSPDGRYDDLYLSNYAQLNVRDELSRLEGVGSCSTYGAAAYSMRIWLNAPRMKSLGLTTEDVLQAIKAQNAQVAAGQVGGMPAPDTQSFQFTVQTLGRLADISQFEDIIIKTASGPAGRVVRVKDVARVELGGETYTVFGEADGKPGALVLVYLLPGANALNVAKSVNKTMEELGKNFPEGVEWHIPYDTSRFVSAAVDEVYKTLFEAAILVLIVIIAFLQDWRATLVPATVIPIAILGGFIAMVGLGFSVNLVTLFGIILAIGIVVDDAIMVVEGAAHEMDKGADAKTATMRAMQKLFGAIIGVTLVLACVFIPASLLSGISGSLYRQFALVIASTAFLSALLAATLTPSQCGMFLRPIVLGRNPFYRAFNKGYAWAEHHFIALLDLMLTHAKLALVVFVAILTFTFWGFATLPTGFLPEEDQGYCIMIVQLPSGAAQPRTRQVTDKIGEILAKDSNIANWITLGGLSVLTNANSSNAATLFVVYKDWSERAEGVTQDTIVAKLRKGVAEIEDAMVLVVTPPPIQGLGNTGGFQMMVQQRAGGTPIQLQDAVYEMIGAGMGQKSLSGVSSTYSAETPQLYVDIDRTQVMNYGIKLNNLFDTMQAYLGSAYVNDFNKFGKSYQVRVQAESQYRLDATDIGKLEVRNDAGNMIPLSTVLNVRSIVGPDVMTRYNLYPAAAVIGSPAPGFSSGDAIATMEGLAQQVLPQGMGYQWTNIAYQEVQVGNQSYIVFSFALLMVFLVLAGLYESWSIPAAIILGVPLALLGTFLAVYLRGMDNNLYTQIGIVLLIALASKNAILIVEYASDLRKSGRTIHDAALEAARERFRPILMTSFAFILGVVPLLTATGAGSSSQRALGTAVFGGMLGSTCIAVLFVPLFFYLIQTASEKTDKRAEKLEEEYLGDKSAPSEGGTGTGQAPAVTGATPVSPPAADRAVDSARNPDVQDNSQQDMPPRGVPRNDADK